MSKLTDLMIDIETMGVNSNAPVLSVGLVAFNLHDPSAEIQAAYVELNWDEQIDSGKRKVDASTLKFWLSQSKEAQKSLFKSAPQGALSALTSINEFCHEVFKGEKFYAWGNGPHFDITIMESLYKDYGATVPWRYNKVNDLRTLQRLAGKFELPREGVYHNALDDSIYQVRVAHEAISRLANKGVSRS